MYPKPTKPEISAVLLLSLLLAITCFAVYYNSLSNDFVWDDRALILMDKTIKDLHNIPRAFSRDFFDFTQEEDVKYGYYRPLVTISYMIDYAVWGENPFGFHLTNLLIHIVCSILVFRLFMSLGLPRRLAFLGGVIFGVHPIHTESVSWISGRTDLFCCLFLLMSLSTYIAYRQNYDPELSFNSPGRFYALSIIFYALSLLSKEMGVVLVFMILVMEWVYKTSGWKDIAKRIAPYLLVTVGYLVWHSMAVRRLTGSRLKMDLSGMYPNIITFFKGFWLYLYKLLLPINLSAYLKLDMLDGFIQPEAIVCFLMFVAFCCLIITVSKKKPLLGLGGGWLLTTMAPLSNITRITSPLDMGFTMAERFMYIPSIAFILILIIGLDWGRGNILKRYSLGWVSGVIIIILVGLLGYRTILRNHDWQDDGRLFNAELESHNESPLIHSNLGKFYERKGKLDKAFSHLQRALQLAPQSSGILNNLGRMLVDMKRFDEAVTYLEEAIATNPYKFQFYNNYGLAVAGLGYHKKAIKAYNSALGIEPGAAQVYNNLGVSFKKAGDIKKAHDNYIKATEYDKNYAAPYKNLAILYMNHLKKPGEALGALRKSLQIDPNQAEAPSMKKLITQLESSQKHKVNQP